MLDVVEALEVEQLPISKDKAKKISSIYDSSLYNILS
jgi:hypothetical protein